VSRWTALVRHHPVSGRKIFDVQLVATLLANGVRKLYTFNRTDFEPFAEIEVLTPVAP
jgi:predicted nucleic acid-binding protein